MTGALARLGETLDLFGEQFAASLLVGGALAYLGVYVLLKRVAFIGVALSQVAFAGIALGYLLGGLWGIDWAGNAEWLAVALSVAAASLLAAPRAERRVTRESVIAAVFALAFAATFLFVKPSPIGFEEIKSLFSGDILTAYGARLEVLLYALPAILLLHLVAMRRFTFVAYDPEMMAACGGRVRVWSFLLYVSLGAAIALGTRAVGILFVAAFLVVPPLTALLLFRRLGAVFAASVAAALVSAGAGFAAGAYVAFPTGALTVAAAGVLLLAAFGVRRLLDARRAPAAPRA